MNLNGTSGSAPDNLLGIGDPYELRRREDEAFTAALEQFRGQTAEQLLSIRCICDFHRAALGAIRLYAGEFRNSSIRVGLHVPQGQSAQELNVEMEQYSADCLYRLELLRQKPQARLSLIGFAFWKLVYIAPFNDGNGRTANGLSILLQQALGMPGKALYSKENAPHYAKFIASLRAYDAGAADAFFEYLRDHLE